MSLQGTPMEKLPLIPSRSSDQIVPVSAGAVLAEFEQTRVIHPLGRKSARVS